MTRHFPGVFGLLGLAAGLCNSGVAHAAAIARTLDVDLAPKIDASVTRREQFAVSVPHVVSLQSDGGWERANGISTWRYSVRIPTAVSMSFHASVFELPSGSILNVTGTDGTSAVYSPGQGSADGLWSRLQRGDVLSFELRVPTRDEAQAQFVLAALHAGYRVLGGGSPDHPHFRKLQGASANAIGAACSRSFACNQTPENSVNGDATAALVIGGVAMCTGVLVNNLRNDGTPYLLTARHCQAEAHSSVVVYWDAVTACGSPLGSMYDTQTPAYLHGAGTVFEQQDVWMIRLSSPINGARAYFAGWDVTGGVFVGGYSPHHALGRTRQFTGWYGQAFLHTLSRAALGVGYDSTYWGVVNSVGNVGSGASGGGLFNPEHRLVGIASLAHLEAGGEGVCPVVSPSAPDANTSAALYNALSSVWESNADTTSFTNPVTLKSLLDPDSTGALVSAGFELLRDMSMRANNEYGRTGWPETITWTAPGATSCTATDGMAGDNWSGTYGANGTLNVTQYVPGQTIYSLRCTDGTRFANRNVRITWAESPPSLDFGASTSSSPLGTSVSMFWRSNVQPCVASGGAAGDGWAGPKGVTATQVVPLDTAGEVTYTMTCGSGGRSITVSDEVLVYAPFATLEAASNNMRVGSEVLLMQTAGGTSCSQSGGAPGDGWEGAVPNYPRRVTATTAGTYRYTLTCVGGPTPAVAFVDLTFTTDPVFATLTASQPRAEVITGPPAADVSMDPRWGIQFTWDSNIAPCQITYDGPGNADGPLHPSMDRPGRGTSGSIQEVVGTYVYRVTCRAGSDVATATTTVEYVAPAPAVTMTFQSETWPANEPIHIGWHATTSPCVATGGSPGDGWAGPKSGMSGATAVTLAAPGTYAYGIACGLAPDIVSESATVIIEAPTVAFLPHDAQAIAGHGIALRWAGSVGPCTQTGDWASAATFPANGANVAISMTAGVRTYGIRCGTTTIVEASTQVTYLPPPTVDLTASVDRPNVNQPVTLSWTSANAASCEVQGTGSAEWNGPLPTSGNRVITRSVPGTVGFYINCGGTIDAVVVEWRSVNLSPQTPAPPTLNFTISHPTRRVGEAVTLTWTTTRAASCRGSEGVNGDAWAGVLPVSGAREIIIDGPGTFSWALTCNGAPPSATARVSTTYTAAPSPPPPSSGSSSGGGSSGGGGGGSLDALWLALLGSLLAFQHAAGTRRRWIRGT